MALDMDRIRKDFAFYHDQFRNFEVDLGPRAAFRTWRAHFRYSATLTPVHTKQRVPNLTEAQREDSNVAVA